MYDKGKKSMENRRYKLDIKAANDAWEILNAPFVAFNANRRKTRHAKWNPERHILLGNHENRIDRAVESDAQLEGVISTDDLIYAKTGWKVHSYLSPVFLDGVGYSHFWYNPMNGRPLGGTAEGRLKTLGHSFTMGHQQTYLTAIRYVNDQQQRGLIAGACYLHDEDYKGPQGNHHWRGILIKHQVNNGAYDLMEVSLDYLCRRYEGMSLDKFIAKKYPTLRLT